MSDRQNGGPGGNGGGPGFNMNWGKSAAIWAIIILLIISVVSLTNQKSDTPSAETIPYSQFVREVDDGKITRITMEDDVIMGEAGGARFRTIAPNDPDLVRRLTEKGVQFTVKEQPETSLFVRILINLAPFLILGLIWYFVMRNLQNGAGRGAMSFGKSKARMLNQQQNRVTFNDVAGIDEAREELQEIVDFLKDPQRFSKSRKALCWSARPARVKPFWPAPSLVKPMCPSFRFPARTLWKCLSASVPAVCGTCLIRRRKMRPASFSLTKSMPLDGTGGLAGAAETMSASRP
jgi:hypothetical protein